MGSEMCIRDRSDRHRFFGVVNCSSAVADRVPERAVAGRNVRRSTAQSHLATSFHYAIDPVPAAVRIRCCCEDLLGRPAAQAGEFRQPRPQQRGQRSPQGERSPRRVATDRQADDIRRAPKQPQPAVQDSEPRGPRSGDWNRGGCGDHGCGG